MRAENQNPTPAKSILKKPLTYSSLLVFAVAVYVVWILFSRHLEERAYEQRVRREQSQKQRESDQAAIRQLGGSELAIQLFYATPQIRRGEPAQVCYGVANAKSVTLEPQPTDPVWPSHSRCVEIKPSKTTTYTLTATGSDGKSVSQQVTVAVR